MSLAKGTLRHGLVFDGSVNGDIVDAGGNFVNLREHGIAKTGQMVFRSVSIGEYRHNGHRPFGGEGFKVEILRADCGGNELDDEPASAKMIIRG